MVGGGGGEDVLVFVVEVDVLGESEVGVLGGG